MKKFFPLLVTLVILAGCGQSTVTTPDETTTPDTTTPTVTEPATPTADSTDTSEDTTKGKKILIVDDDIDLTITPPKN